MDFAALRRLALTRVEPAALAYQHATAGLDVDADRDVAAWHQLDLLPRVLRGVRSIDTSTALLGVDVATPLMIAATAAHSLSHADGEPATARAADRAGVLMTYSSSASVEVTEFGRTITRPWWAQVYVMKDRGLTRDYLARVVAAGASGVVLTVDNPGTLGDAPFRSELQGHIKVRPGNYPTLTWQEMSADIEPELGPAHVAELAESTGLPVIVKGVVHPADAAVVVRAGAAALIVSNHGRRQLAGVIPTAMTLPEIVRAVAGRVPVLVDGGIRSGVDVLRALALGAQGVGIGRPVLWGLAAAGSDGVFDVLAQLTGELRQAMASVGAATLADLTPDLVRLPR